jgi:ATP/maltotriose-dependent transcriptional regulator MalT
MDHPNIPHHPVLVEDLTERELDVLRLMAQGLSNREIAEQLVIALSTVKWYVGQIYDKLGVQNRRQAVARAQALGLTEEPPTPSIRPHHNLPAQTTPFIGRAQECADLAALLADPAVRVITILAPGGMGKTRLGLAVAEAHLDRFADGVYMVPLAPLRSAPTRS